MALRAKVCPHCEQRFLRRNSMKIDGKKKYVCPHCCKPVHLTPDGEAIKEEDRAQYQRVFDHFCEYMKPRNVFFGPVGSNVYLRQMGLTKQLVNRARTQLGYVSLLDIHPADFTIMVIDHIFSASDYANWARKIDTISMCNGQVFVGAAAEVAQQIKQERASVAKEALFDSSRMSIPVMHLG